MTLKSQDYAALAEDAYEDRAVGRRDPSQETAIDIGGHMYKVLEHVNDRRTGYQGTVYLREDTNEVIVAHRGTEQILHDALIADAGMVVARTNTQAPEAIALTRRAEGFDDVGLRGAGGELLGQPLRDHALEDDVRGVAEHAGREHGEHDPQGAEHGDEREGPGVRTQQADQSPEARAEIRRLAGRHAVPVARVQPGLLGQLEFGALLFGQCICGAHASTPSCDSTISR